MRLKTLACAVLSALGMTVGGADGPGFHPLTDLDWHFVGDVTRTGNVLVVHVPDDAAKKDAKAWAKIDLSDYSFGGFEVRIKGSGENIRRPARSKFGLKVMVKYTELSGNRDTFYPQASGRDGSFGWTTLSCTDASPGRLRGKGTLVLGLEKTSGTVRFDLDTLELGGAEPLTAMTNETYRVAYPDETRRLGPLRGVMLPLRPCEKDFADLKAWGATLVRFQMKRPVRGWSFERLKDRDLFNRWLDEELDLLDSVVLPQAEKNDIQVIVDLHSVPGGNGRIFHDSACVETFVDAWKRIATRFRGRENVYGYDLINEPAQGRKGVCDYWQLQDRAAHEIRRIDPSVAIVVEANSLDSPAAFAYLSPLAMDNVIYQVHVYNPGAYTHQGVGQGGREGAGFSWAAASKGDGKSYLRKVLNPVVAFQKRHGARILVGEFSAICWAPGAADYLRDAIEVFEENGWDWTYHAFREWRPWSVEHEGVSSAEMKPSSDNDRMRVLKEAFAAGRSR